MTPEQRFDIIDAAVQTPLLWVAAKLHGGQIALLKISAKAHDFNVALARKGMK